MRTSLVFNSTQKLEKSCGSRKEFDHLKDALSKVNFVGMRKEEDACALYTYLFPNEDEREPWGKITDRLAEMSALGASPALQAKHGDGRFHVVLAENAGDIVGYSQFSTLPVGDNEVVVYWQYGGIADRGFMASRYGRDEDFRVQGIGSAYYPIRHAVAAEVARETGRSGVMGTIIESEFIGQAAEDDAIKFTRQRLFIHNRSGMMAMMLDMGEGNLVTAHIQPRLSADTEPIMLHALFRPLSIEGLELGKIREINPELAYSLMMAFIDNFDREGFNRADVAEGRATVNSRFSAAKRVLLMPPDELPDIVDLAGNDPLLKAQVERDYGSVEAQRERIRNALA
jgi:hypothetical protein